jgi:hypothetical protein
MNIFFVCAKFQVANWLARVFGIGRDYELIVDWKKSQRLEIAGEI